MRIAVLIKLNILALLTGCSGASTSTQNPDLPQEVASHRNGGSKNELSLPFEYRRENMMKGEIAYSSTTRDWLIKNDRRYNHGADTFRYDFRGLNSTFFCEHDTGVISQLNGFGWDFVKCFDEHLAFLKMRDSQIEEPIRCSQQRLLHYEFDEVSVFFDPEWGRNEENESQALLSPILRRKASLSSVSLERELEKIFPKGFEVFLPIASPSAKARKPLKYTVASFSTNESLSFEYPFEWDTCPRPTTYRLLKGSDHYAIRTLSSDLFDIAEEGRKLFGFEGSVQ
ncbi:hypothetical protein [Erythrobacter sp.]|uniref:hypothetical protein n=1 Tax=Erythrobacter sp. TaxID=1042 RepID=UPI003C773EE5